MAGADGEFTLYEDDGQGTWTRITRDDSEKRLTIEPDPRTKGKPLPPRTFSVVLLPVNTRKTVGFAGTRVDVVF